MPFPLKVFMILFYLKKLDTLRERRPPWPRQIIHSHIVHCKVLSLGGERLPPKKNKTQKKQKQKTKKQQIWIITCTTIWACYDYYGVFSIIYSS